MGKDLLRTLRKLQRLGWRMYDDRYTSPYTKIDYEFEQACRIEDLPVPDEKPGDALWKWLES